MQPDPHRGGYARGFGAARFVLDFLGGQGDKYGVDTIDPAVGAPQVEIHYHYKEALRRHAIEQPVGAGLVGETPMGRVRRRTCRKARSWMSAVLICFHNSLVNRL